MSTKYKKQFGMDWTATCPKCDKNITMDMYHCSNCEKGNIKAGRTTGRWSFGCDRCNTSIGSLRCPDCKADITSDFIRPTEECIEGMKKEVLNTLLMNPKMLLFMVGLPILFGFLSQSLSVAVFIFVFGIIFTGLLITSMYRAGTKEMSSWIGRSVK